MHSKSAARACFALAILLANVAATRANADEKTPPAPKVKIDWTNGPLTARLGDVAEVKIPAGYKFTGKEGTRKFLELTQNPPSGS